MNTSSKLAAMKANAKGMNKMMAVLEAEFAKGRCSVAEFRHLEAGLETLTREGWPQ